jgi:hypothetical protein
LICINMNPYKNLPSDTPDHVLKIQHDIVMRKTPLERLKMCCDMADFSMAMVRKLIKDKRPDISEGELKYETIKLVYADCYTEEDFARIRVHFVGSKS